MGLGYKITLSSSHDYFEFEGQAPTITIGRADTCDFVIPKQDFSREHCRVEINEDDIYITDLGSKNGVLINNKRIIPHQRTLLSPDSQVILAQNYHLNFGTAGITLKSKKDHFTKRPIQAGEMTQTKTITLHLDTPQPKVVKKNLPSPKKTIPEIAPEKRRDWVKIAIASSIIFAFIVFRMVMK